LGVTLRQKRNSVVTSLCRCKLRASPVFSHHAYSQGLCKTSARWV